MIGQYVLGHLRQATESRFPPLVQYMNEEPKPILDYSLPTIDVIGDGMYVNYPTRTLPSGQKVKDLAGKKSYHVMGLRHNWNAISSFEIRIGRRRKNER